MLELALLVVVLYFLFKSQVKAVMHGAGVGLQMVGNSIEQTACESVMESVDDWEHLFNKAGITSGTFEEKKAALKKLYGLH